jgi:hypothetical protein
MKLFLFPKTYVIQSSNFLSSFYRGVEKERLKNFALSQISFFFLLCSERHFFSFTETLEEISMVVDEESLFLFPESTIKISATAWRALSVTLGSSGYSKQLFFFYIY